MEASSSSNRGSDLAPPPLMGASRRPEPPDVPCGGAGAERGPCQEGGGRSTMPPHAPRDCQLAKMLEASVDI